MIVISEAKLAKVNIPMCACALQLVFFSKGNICQGRLQLSHRIINSLEAEALKRFVAILTSKLFLSEKPQQKFFKPARL